MNIDNVTYDLRVGLKGSAGPKGVFQTDVPLENYIQLNPEHIDYVPIPTHRVDREKTVQRLIARLMNLFDEIAVDLDRLEKINRGEPLV